MRKSHASQYANFGWLHTKMKANHNFGHQVAELLSVVSNGSKILK